MARADSSNRPFGQPARRVKDYICCPTCNEHVGYSFTDDYDTLYDAVDVCPNCGRETDRDVYALVSETVYFKNSTNHSVDKQKQRKMMN